MSIDTPRTTDEFSDAPAGRMRLLPSVAFAGRASALTRVALPVAMLAAGIVASVSGVSGQESGLLHTTCCPPNIS